MPEQEPNMTPDDSTSSLPKSFRYYHAGPLFTLAELHMNTLLANAISSKSGQRFSAILPQDIDFTNLTPQIIRDRDINELIASDLALFTYDGVELDPGTVVEYMVAKMADIPAVILRTDIRGGGDQQNISDGEKADPWNLMSSFWPRTKVVTIDSFSQYQTAFPRAVKAGQSHPAGEYMIDQVADQVVQAFEEVLKVPPRLPKELRKGVYQWLALMPGFKEGTDQENVEKMLKTCESKAAKNLL